ncbi:MAG: SOS response-associated peptidase family protein [Betaproteobacteria bacterium]|uniref:SOS response-associated peptidase n=1 Tax=Ferrovum sp. PN-J185 TaxID=1356306 RepID=UPI000796ADB6|nr:SOS response-associated peptidase family protein [Ferrovum sp. PN-J185]KXW56532.1 putative SOS response-associated peptidase YedK [Ferrovum sp. PN-J185]MDE1891769.1 SOS response-associated peptidase family protein [Betaproteobacteria bacterium]MDE2056385.1 SOS response-associated peptidase family protein [Betaproteobacteria bacterium]
MCINFTPTKNKDWTKSVLDVDLPHTYPKEVFPSYPAPIIIFDRKNERHKCGLAEFGLIPSWSKDKKIQRYTYNARHETVKTKPSYKDSWFNRRFALCILDNFFEPSYESGKPERYCIQRIDKRPIGIASLWDTWIDKETNQKIISFTMLTCNVDTHPVMKRFHRIDDEKRSPVILDEEQFNDWLTATPDTAINFMKCDMFPTLDSFRSVNT